MTFISDRPRILVAQLGARRRYAVPIALHRAGMLGLLVTDVAAHDLIGQMANAARHVWPNRFLKKLSERRIPEIPPDKIETFPWFGFSRRLAAIANNGRSVRFRHARDNAKFASRVAKLALKDFDAVYVFNGAGLEIAQAAKEAGLKVILDQTSAPIRVEEEILAEERHRWPGWELDAAVSDGWEFLARREEAEWELADLILCGSQYVCDSLVRCGVSPSKCRVVPTGVCPPAPFNLTSELIKKRFENKLVLFAGTLCLRKGIPYLVEAARRLKGFASVRAVGHSNLTEKALARVREVIDYRGNLSPQELWREYENASVFVLPTLSEGSANVCFEAMAAGLPVITTPNAGSVIENDRQGFVVSVRNAVGLEVAVRTLLGSWEVYAHFVRQISDLRFAYSQRRYETELTTILGRLTGK